MRHRNAALLGAGLAVCLGGALASAAVLADTSVLFDWAYPQGPREPIPPLAAGVYHLPDSKLSFTGKEIDSGIPDWRPKDHPPLPTVVIAGRKDGPPPCAECHGILGQGDGGTPDLAGLPEAYIVQQVGEFAAGRRASTQTGRGSTGAMIAVARKVTPSDLAQAAAYFSNLPRRPPARVEITSRVPVTRPFMFGWRVLVPGGGLEPIADRIIELPQDETHDRLGDPIAAMVAYIPPGSIARGAALVHSGGPGGLSCAACHGADLRGAALAPPIAGRLAPYLARQLWDMHTGARSGPAVALMAPVVRDLTPAQITDIAAYLVSLPPTHPSRKAG